MSTKSISFMIVPHGKGKQKTITLSKKRIRRALWTGGVVGGFLLIWLFYSVLTTGVHFKYRDLKDENISQRNQIVQYEETLTSLKNKIKSMEDYALKINIMAGLQSSDVLTQSGLGNSAENDQDLTVPPAPLAPPQSNLESLSQKAGMIEHNLNSLMNFFEDKRYILDATPSISPTKGYISSGYKMRNDPITGRRQFHWGIDVVTPTGNPIFATADGIILSTKYDKIGGNTVKISHPRTGFTTLYCHLSKYNVKSGQKVKRGDVIGYVGATGKATGPHVHYEVKLNGKSVNPYYYLLEEE